MIRLIFLVSLLLLASCSTGSGKKKSFKETINMASVQVSSKDVSSKQEAKAQIIGFRNYLKLLFEQSRDPYYGSLKWPEACLDMNRIGEVMDTGSSIYLANELILNHQGNPRHCSGPIQYHLQFFCDKENKIYTYKFMKTTKINFQEFDLCQ